MKPSKDLQTTTYNAGYHINNRPIIELTQTMSAIIKKNYLFYFFIKIYI